MTRRSAPSPSADLVEQLCRRLIRLGVQLLHETLGKTLIHTQRLGAFAKFNVARHERAHGIFMQIVAREQAAICVGRFRMTLLFCETAGELHQRIAVQSLQSVAMLEVPIAGRFAVE